MIKYIELKSGYSDNGPAWIANVKQSRTGTTIYFNGIALKRANVIKGNYFDSATGDEYWISNVKKRGSNRHWAGNGKISVETNAVEELKEHLQVNELDPKQFETVPDFPETDIHAFHERENMKL